jgi:hypothetical protein
MSTTHEQREEVRGLDPAKVARVYSGKPGCGCGCRGKYWDDGRNVRRVVKAMKAHLDEAEEAGRQDSTGCHVVFVQTATRYYWAYLA